MLDIVQFDFIIRTTQVMRKLYKFGVCHWLIAKSTINDSCFIAQLKKKSSINIILNTNAACSRKSYTSYCDELDITKSLRIEIYTTMKINWLYEQQQQTTTKTINDIHHLQAIWAILIYLIPMNNNIYLTVIVGLIVEYRFVAQNTSLLIRKLICPNYLHSIIALFSLI